MHSTLLPTTPRHPPISLASISHTALQWRFLFPTTCRHFPSTRLESIGNKIKIAQEVDDDKRCTKGGNDRKCFNVALLHTRRGAAKVRRERELQVEAKDRQVCRQTLWVMEIKAAFLKKKGIKKKTIWLIVEQNILERERSIGAACEDGKLRCNCKLSVCPASSKELLRRKRKWKFNALRDLLRVYNISLLIIFLIAALFEFPDPNCFLYHLE